jgi:myo-inositol-1(or 4)-monophosphatase
MKQLSFDELKEIHDFACDLARRAGKTLRDDQFRRRTGTLESKEKMNSVDLVTSVDEEIEKLIR